MQTSRHSAAIHRKGPGVMIKHAQLQLCVHTLNIAPYAHRLRPPAGAGTMLQWTVAPPTGKLKPDLNSSAAQLEPDWLHTSHTRAGGARWRWHLIGHAAGPAVLAAHVQRGHRIPGAPV